MSPLEVVQQFYRALERKDFDTFRDCLNEPFSFRGPFDTFNSISSYVQAIQRLSSIVKRVEVHKMFADGNDVCVLYDLVTGSPVETSFISEWFQVKDGKIVSIRVVFDPRPFEFLQQQTK
jgi:ketosteroid isomerase-like protein